MVGSVAVAAKGAKAQARAEGLVLVTADNMSGFKGVCRDGRNFKARVMEAGKQIHLGKFSTAEAAALAYARHIRTAAAAEDADELSATQAQSRAERLVLAQWHKGGGKLVHLGCFSTAEAAVLAYAGHLGSMAAPADGDDDDEEDVDIEDEDDDVEDEDGDGGSEAAAAEDEVDVVEDDDENVDEAATPELMANEAKAQATAEGLVLVASNNASGCKGVYWCHNDKFEARAWGRGKRISLGYFSTDEGATLSL
eukprot:6405609-Prymnesium_polylepis.2